MTYITANLLGSNIAATTMATMSDEVCGLATRRQSSYICFATAHMVFETTRNRAIEKAYAEATIVTPDGVPVSWFIRKLSSLPAECISGPRLFPALLQKAQEHRIRVGFYGGREDTLRLLQAKLALEFPSLELVYCFSPPFRALSAEEQATHIADINASGAQMLFVSLGSPKQECWMNDHSRELDCVCLGVGAAFEFFSGEKVLPPVWVQKLGITWLVRLCQEPRRLFMRNLYSLPFLFMALRWTAMDDAHRNHWRQRILRRLSRSAVQAATT